MSMQLEFRVKAFYGLLYYLFIDRFNHRVRSNKSLSTIILALIMVALLGCGKNEKEKASAPLEVTIIKVKEETLPAISEYVGFVESSHPVEIRARVEGYLNKISYTEGSDVHEGDLLFQIDPLQFKAALDDAAGELKKQEAILWDAKVTAERLKPLYEKKAASQRDLDTAVAQQLGAEAAVESSKARLRTAQLNLSYTTIKSPITGLSTLSNFREGALIIPGETGLLTTISVIDPVWIKFYVSSNDLQKLASEFKLKRIILPQGRNFDVELVLSDDSVFPYMGKVDFAAPTLDPSTGTMVFRATLQNPRELGLSQLRPGQFVRVKLLGAMRPSAIAIPQRAVQQGQTGMYVFIVNSEGKAETRAVEAGDWYQDQWIILRGLASGDEVIVDGVNKVMAGQKVTAIPAKK